MLTVKYVHGVPLEEVFFGRNQAKQDLQRHPICLTDSEITQN